MANKKHSKKNAPQESRRHNLSEEDRLRANTNIKNPCSNPDLDPENQNPLYPPGASCARPVPPTDPKEPPKANDPYFGYMDHPQRPSRRDMHRATQHISADDMASERYYYWTDEEGELDMTPQNPGQGAGRASRRNTYFNPRQVKPQSSRNAFDAVEERLSGTPVDAAGRYYYWSDGVMPPEMTPSRNHYGAEPHPSLTPVHRQHYDTVRYGDMEARRAIPVRYDGGSSDYSSEYGAVSDAYYHYLQDRNRGRYQYDGDYFPNYYETDYGINAYDRYYNPQQYQEPTLSHSDFYRYRRPRPQTIDADWSVVEPRRKKRDERPVQDSFHFSEEVIEKIAAQAVYDVDGVLALSGNMADSSLLEEPAAEAHLNDDKVVIDLNVVLAYGINGRDVLREVKDNVCEQIQAMTGLSVDAVHIEVVDIMAREEFNARYDSQAPELQRQQIEAQRRREAEENGMES